MKEPLKAPFIFALIFAGALIVLAALEVLAVWGLHDSAGGAFTAAAAVKRLPRALLDVMIPAVVLAIVLMGFRMAWRPFSRFLGLVIILAAGYVVLVNGVIWFRSLARSSPPAAETPRQYLQPGTFTRVGGSIVAVRDMSGTAVRGILQFDPARRGGRFTVYAAGTASSRAGTVSIVTTSRPPTTIAGSADLSWTGVFAPDRFTALFLRDIGTLTSDFEALLARSLPEFFGACFAIVFLCTASFALLRITRWPLANAMLLVIAVRGYFSLYHLLAVTLAPQVSRVISDSTVARLSPSAAFVAIGVILLLIDVLLIPADRWTRPEGA